MQTNFDTIFPEIRDKLIIKEKTGFVRDDFIRNTQTFLITAQIPTYRQIRYASYITVSDAVLEDSSLCNDIVGRLEKDCAKPIWRINQKRVAHGFKSWF
jgi:hypothetical protein